MEQKEHILSLLVCNKPGTLIRIALVFSRRGYNIDSLVVSASPDPRFSVMNITSIGEADGFQNVIKQLKKLVDVVYAIETTDEHIIQRELALIKIFCEKNVRSEILQLAKALQCDIIDLDDSTIVLEVNGHSNRIERIRKIFSPYGELEWMRTGKILMMRGKTDHFK